MSENELAELEASIADAEALLEGLIADKESSEFEVEDTQAQISRLEEDVWYFEAEVESFTRQIEETEEELEVLRRQFKIAQLGLTPDSDDPDQITFIE